MLAGFLHRFEQRVGRAQFQLNQVPDHFGIGIGGENKAFALQTRTQLGMIFNNAIMDHGNMFTGHMGVGILLIGHTVRGPAGMGNAGTTG